MLKRIALLGAATAVSMGLLTLPAEARGRHDNRGCGDNTAAGTAAGAVVGAILGAEVNRGRGDTGAAIVGGILGAVIGNAISRDDCRDNRYDAYYYDRAHYDAMRYGRTQSWRNPHTGAHGDFRINRTYDDRGYWQDDRWYSSDARYDRRGNDNGRYDNNRGGDRRYDNNRDRRTNGRQARDVQATCRQYTDTQYRPGRRSQTHVVCRDMSGDWRVVS